MPDPAGPGHRRPGDWWEVTARPTGAGPGPDHEAEALTEMLRSRAGSGVAIGASGTSAYFASEPEAGAAAAELRLRWPGAEVVVRPVREEDWAGWRKAFRLVAAGERLWVYPAWEAPPAPAAVNSPGGAARGPEIPVVIEPGLAFGTGDHPTTAGCLRYLDRTVWPGCEALDLGTGSGVLAIAAALLGAARVTAVDLDPVACRAAADNLLLNPAARGRVAVRCLDARALPPRPVDVVVANLATDLLVELAPHLLRHLRPGGWLIASGISQDRGPEAEAALAGAGLAVAGRCIERGWTTVLLRRVAP